MWRRYGPGQPLPDRDPTPPDPQCCECEAPLPCDGGGGRDEDLCEECSPICTGCERILRGGEAPLGVGVDGLCAECELDAWLQTHRRRRRRTA